MDDLLEFEPCPVSDQLQAHGRKYQYWIDDSAKDNGRTLYKLDRCWPDAAGMNWEHLGGFLNAEAAIHVATRLEDEA